jgi:quinolinate synthase
METQELINRIKAKKKEFGKALVILTHHYQRKDIVDLGDFCGDSFALSAKAAKDKNAQYIVFCGVHFMAESAAILAQTHQVVQIPDSDAGCWMADMADSVLLEKAWTEITGIVKEEKIIPLVYMNSDAHIKAHCGQNNGIICTSSNAPKAFEWAYKRGEKIFFFPDEHLGRNTGNSLGIPKDEMIVWDPAKPLGGNSQESIKKAKVILWKGYCLVHTRFTTDQIIQMKEKYPDAKVVVHPECTEDVVGLADAVGSTSFIVNYVENADKGSVIVIGTEINLVERLGLVHKDKTIIPLKNSLCPNMYKINLENLLYTLINIGKVNIIDVDDSIKKDAKLALDRMLTL